VGPFQLTWFPLVPSSCFISIGPLLFLVWCRRRLSSGSSVPMASMRRPSTVGHSPTQLPRLGLLYRNKNRSKDTKGEPLRDCESSTIYIKIHLRQKNLSAYTITTDCGDAKLFLQYPIQLGSLSQHDQHTVFSRIVFIKQLRDTDPPQLERGNHWR